MPAAGCEPSWQLISRSDGSGLSLGDVDRRYSGTPRYLSNSRSKRRRLSRDAVASAEVISLSQHEAVGLRYRRDVVLCKELVEAPLRGNLALIGPISIAHTPNQLVFGAV